MNIINIWDQKMTENKDKINIKEKKTKERIFEAAIDIFALKGYDATSMREIAEAVGIKKASMYSHYKSKDEILEKILEYPIGRMGNIGPQDIGTEELIVSMGLEKFMALAGDLALSWMEDPQMEKIWRIICIELYHNQQIKKFFSEFTDLSLSYWASAFEIMMKHKLIKPSNPRILAMEYLSFYGNAYMDYFLLHYDNTSGSFLQEYKGLTNQHIMFIVNSIKA
jgi:AcrR family transcriptional regulator